MQACCGEAGMQNPICVRMRRCRSWTRASAPTTPPSHTIFQRWVWGLSPRGELHDGGPGPVEAACAVCAVGGSRRLCTQLFFCSSGPEPGPQQCAHRLSHHQYEPPAAAQLMAGPGPWIQLSDTPACWWLPQGMKIIGFLAGGMVATDPKSEPRTLGLGPCVSVVPEGVRVPAQLARPWVPATSSSP